jgi:acyl-CoA thioester hydrolase
VQHYSVTITPRFYETDALGHINNATIVAWFEIVRVNFLEELQENDPAAAKRWILASLQVDFKAETFYGSDVIASITDASVGNSSFTVICEMTQGDKLTVLGKAVLVYMGAEATAPTRIPDSVRQQLAAR